MTVISTPAWSICMAVGCPVVIIRPGQRPDARTCTFLPDVPSVRGPVGGHHGLRDAAPVRYPAAVGPGPGSDGGRLFPSRAAALACRTGRGSDLPARFDVIGQHFPEGSRVDGR